MQPVGKEKKQYLRMKTHPSYLTGNSAPPTDAKAVKETKMALDCDPTEVTPIRCGQENAHAPRLTLTQDTSSNTILKVIPGEGPTQIVDLPDGNIIIAAPTTPATTQSIATSTSTSTTTTATATPTSTPTPTTTVPKVTMTTTGAVETTTPKSSASFQVPPGCYLHAVPWNPAVFINRVAFDTPQHCPPSTVFRQESCVCVHSSAPTPRPVCEPLFDLDFTRGVRNTVQGYPIGYADTVMTDAGVAVFRPRSNLVLWTFSRRSFGTSLALECAFKDYRVKKQSQQVLVTNCYTYEPLFHPSLLVLLDNRFRFGPNGDESLLRVLVRTTWFPYGLEVSVPYKAGQINTMRVQYFGSALEVSVRYANGETRYARDNLFGSVLPGAEALRLGSCPGHSMGFFGEIHKFKFYPCRPAWNF